MAESTIKLEDGTIQQITVKGPQLNRDGAVLEGARAFITVKVPLDGSGVEAHLGTFTRLIKRDRQIKFIDFRFIEQLELEALKDTTPLDPAKLHDPLGSFPAIAKNGSGKPVDDTPPRHIGEVIDGERPSERAMRETEGARKKSKAKT